MRIRFTLIALLLACAASAQEKSGDSVWKWVDKEGVTHYSDQPGPGAVKVDLRIQTYSAPQAQPPAPRASNQSSRSTARYESLAITVPQADQTLQAADGPISIGLRIEPGLQAGHRIRIDLDGVPQGQPTASLSVTVREVPRGSHTLQASVVAEDGSILVQSVPITFHVQQPGLLSPGRKP